MKATARAHPIQGLVKYHGIRDYDLRVPYHDSISVATAPSATVTTVEFDSALDDDRFIVDGDPLEASGSERLRAVVEEVRRRADATYVDRPVRLESENTFPSNIGLGSSSSGFAAAAMALSAAADLDAPRGDISTIARRGSTSAARAVTGGFSDLRAGMNDKDSRSHRLETTLEDDLRIVVGLVPTYKETQQAHDEAEDSHMFQGRLAHVHAQLADLRDAIRRDDFHDAFAIAEKDTLSLAATTMTGPEGWVYWQPETLAIFEAVRDLRDEGVPVYFSTDTGATVYVNTLEEHVDRVEETVAAQGVETMTWRVGGPATVLDESESIF